MRDISKGSLVLAGALAAAMGMSTGLAQDAPGPEHAFEQNARLGRGVNVLSADPRWTSPSEARMKERHFKLIKAAGFDNVRIVVKPFKFSGAGPDYALDPGFFATLDWAIEQALSNRLMAIVDLQENHAMGEDPRGQKARFLSVWKQIAHHCRDYPHEVLFEVCNEPNMPAPVWNEIHQEALTILREHNPDRAVLIGSIYGNQIQYLADLSEVERPLVLFRNPVTVCNHSFVTH